MSIFKKATKSLTKAKIAITGPSGSGKTLSSLLLAKGMGGRVAVIDTENNSASLYEDRFPGWDYYVLPISPPYSVQKYLQAIDAAVNEKFEVLIIDSLSHAWAAEGGLLQQKEALDSRGGNSYTNWGSITKLYEQLKSKILHSNINLIVTMRSKQDYLIETNDRGKQAPKKVGLAPIMRDGMEYEFTTVFDIGMDHQFTVSKDRTGLFDGTVSTITESTGKDLMSWLCTSKIGNETTQVEPPAEAKPAPTKQEIFHPEETPAADYVPRIGKYMGKKLSELNTEELVAYYVELEKKEFEKFPPQGKELFEKLDQYLMELEGLKTTEAEPVNEPLFDDE